MKSIAISLRESLLSRLSRTAPQPSSPHDHADIRAAMLALLAEPAGAPHAQTRLRVRLQVTHDIEALWHLRTELFNHLCQSRDQQFATSSLQSLEPLFEPHLPRNRFRTHQQGDLLAPNRGDRRDRALSRPSQG